MTLLVQYYNLIIKYQFYLSRWLKILDIIIKKGKGPVVRKLRMIQLIEVDIQILMRIVINKRNKGRIEVDLRISKCNYGSRSRYSIKNAILEKRIIYDHSMLKENTIIHNITNLQTYYNRQLAEIGSIVQELVGV